MKKLGFIVCLSTLSSCAQYPFEATRAENVVMTGRLSGCFIGCDWKLQLSEGKACRGFSGGKPSKETSLPINVLVFCQGEPNRTLSIASYEPNGQSEGSLDGDPIVIQFR